MNNDLDIDTIDFEDIIQKEKHQGNEEKGTEKRKGWKTTIILIALSIVIVILSYQFFLYPGKENVSLNSNLTSNNSTDNGTNNNANINLTDDDKKFLTWISLSYTPIKNDLICIVDAAKKENFIDTELCAKLLKEDAQRSAEQIDQFNDSNLSSSVNIIIPEYRLALESYYIAGQNLEKGAKNKDSKLMSNASIDIQKGNMYINKVDNLLPKNII